MKIELILLAAFAVFVHSKPENHNFKKPLMINTKEMANINGSYYFISALTATFLEAATQCNDLGMKLLSIQSEEKQLMLNAYLDNNGHSEHYFYTSGLRAYEDVFIWSGTGQIFDFTYWYADNGEPDELTNTVDVCVRLLSSALYTTFQWEDIPCGLNNYFICEQIDKFD